MTKKHLTDEQKQVLSLLSEQWHYIAKDENGYVCIYEFEPNKGKLYFYEYIGRCCYIKDLFKEDMFDYLSWQDKEATLIEDLLK
ncbi:MAG: hypothetical protein RR623_10600 [Bacilli bacterium]